MKPKLYKALGLMSGTSIDGIDAALIETDGENHVLPLGFVGVAYDPVFREKLRSFFGNKRDRNHPAVKRIERELTEKHAVAVKALLKKLEQTADLIGFHGQTLYHNPAARETVQIGDGALLAQLTGVDVVNDFRTADVKAGGNGAPLVPLYHQALVSELAKPVLILNIGGVSNVTWIGKDNLIAFDVGPGNALLDDWMLRHTGRTYDDGGALAATGRVDQKIIDEVLKLAFFQKPAPKSLDREAFHDFMPAHEAAEDGAATLTMLTVRAVADSLRHVPEKPKVIYVTGGGRHNATMMRWIRDVTGIEIRSVDDLGWNGDAIEAEAFAWLAVRSVRGLPLTLPSTTGVPKPMTGGIFYKA